MHRLREWFGVKDWYGPQQTAQKPNQLLNAVTNEPDEHGNMKTNIENEKTTGPVPPPVHNAADKQAILKQVVVSNKQSQTLYDGAEKWLKQYIPHEEGTCFGCKLVVMATTLAYSMFVASLTITKYKKFNSNYRRLFVFTGFTSTIFGLSFLCLTFNDQDPMVVFKTSKKDENN